MRVNINRHTPTRKSSHQDKLLPQASWVKWHFLCCSGTFRWFYVSSFERVNSPNTSTWSDTSGSTITHTHSQHSKDTARKQNPANIYRTSSAKKQRTHKEQESAHTSSLCQHLAVCTSHTSVRRNLSTSRTRLVWKEISKHGEATGGRLMSWSIFKHRLDTTESELYGLVD